MATIGNLALLRERINHTYGDHEPIIRRLYSAKHSPGLIFLKGRRSILNGRAMANLSVNYESLPVVSTSALINDTSNLSKDIDQTRSIHDAIKESNHNLPHHLKLSLSLRMIIEVITFIWRLPGLIVGLLTKEKKLVDTVEEDINEAADLIKVAAKVVEEVAEDIEKVAEKVDEMMDEVKQTTKIAHNEVEEAIDSLGGSVQDVEKSVGKAQVKVKVSKEGATNTQETTTTMTPSSSSSPTTTTTAIATTTTTPKVTTPSPFVSMIYCKPFHNLTWHKGQEILIDFSQAILASLYRTSPLQIGSAYRQKLFVMMIVMISLFHMFGATSPLIL